ncbi:MULTISPECIES: hypothetical protein [unclassified Sporosarcina]|nr:MULTISPECIES: hypothetical protein [unclassified Sporosarcina]
MKTVQLESVWDFRSGYGRFSGGRGLSFRFNPTFIVDGHRTLICDNV